MSDKETAPQVSHLLGKYLNTMVADLRIEGKGQYLRDLFSRYEAELAVECRAPAPQPCESCAGSGYFTVTYEMAADAGQPDRYGAQEECRTCGGSGRAATPQVTPTREHCHADSDGDCEWEGCPQEQKREIYCRLAAADDAEGEEEGTSEQASPTPEECPKCKSRIRRLYRAPCDICETPDSWHSSAGEVERG